MLSLNLLRGVKVLAKRKKEKKIRERKRIRYGLVTAVVFPGPVDPFDCSNSCKMCRETRVGLRSVEGMRAKHRINELEV